MAAENGSSPSLISENAEPSKHSIDQLARSPQRPAKIARTVEDCSDDEEQPQSISPQIMSQNPRHQRYLVAIEYIGTRFSGFQQQPNFRTVLGVLQEAFHKFIGKPVSISCSSRTDAGVHALSNVCHVDVERVSKRRPGEVLPPHDPAVVRKAVNHFLQKEGDVSVIDVRCVPSDFHARFKALERTYFYRFLSGPEPLSIFERDRAWHVTEELDILNMQRACKVLVGHHDFSSFRSSGCQAKSPVRTLDELHVSEFVSTPNFPSITKTQKVNVTGEDPLAYHEESGNNGTVSSSITTSQNIIANSKCGIDQGFGARRKHHCYVITARAHAFLYHQVRLLVGVLKSVGTGDLTISDVERILDAKSVTAASPMAPACGLYLGNVKYDLL